MPPGRRNRAKKPPPAPKLHPALYPELNETFYLGDPSEYLLCKIEALSLMLASDEALAPVYATNREMGGFFLGPMDVPPRESRLRYLRLESVQLLHHAAEALLRLFYAHVEEQDSPWLGIAASTDFREFKKKIAKSLSEGFKSDDIARVFLGGTSPTDAGIEVSEAEFADTTLALDLLLHFAARTFTQESFLYNAAKHGLTVVQTDESSRMVFEFDGEDEPVPIHSGPQLAYLHKQREPGARGGPEWYLSLTGSLPGQDLGVASLIQRAVSSLWDVARRRYGGEPGSVFIVPSSVVLDAMYGAVLNSGNIVRTVSSELVKEPKAGSDTPPATDHRFVNQGVPSFDHWTPGASSEAAMYLVGLPVRDQDRRLRSTSSRHLLPISPAGSTRV